MVVEKVDVSAPGRTTSVSVGVCQVVPQPKVGRDRCRPARSTWPVASQLFTRHVDAAETTAIAIFGP